MDPLDIHDPAEEAANRELLANPDPLTFPYGETPEEVIRERLDDSITFDLTKRDDNGTALYPFWAGTHDELLTVLDALRDVSAFSITGSDESGWNIEDTGGVIEGHNDYDYREDAEDALSAMKNPAARKLRISILAALGVTER